MQIHQIPIRNPLRNYMYLLVCERTKIALAIDPLDHSSCLKFAAEQGLNITHVLNTHHHHDHIGGNAKVVAVTGAQVLAHKEAVSSIPNVDVGLVAGDKLNIGELIFDVMHTPGHTMSHVCLFYQGGAQEAPALFCGDTLFNAGVGRCDFGGDPVVMHETFVEQIFPLPDEVRVFPGHDYIENNLGFTLDREPSNQEAKSLLERFKAGLDAESYVSTIGLERKINVFFRLDNAEIREKLSTQDDLSTFVALRKIRDQW